MRHPLFIFEFIAFRHPPQTTKATFDKEGSWMMRSRSAMCADYGEADISLLNSSFLRYKQFRHKMAIKLIAVYGKLRYLYI